MPVPRDEQETILNYCAVEKKWHVYTDVPSHIRKYKDILISPAEQWENGEIITVSGILSGTVSLRKRTEMTDAQKQAAAERLAKARQKGQS